MAKSKEPEIRKAYKPSERDEEAIKHVYDRYYAMRDNPQRQDFISDCDRAEKAWDQLSKEDEYLEDWQADYFVPLTTAVVESILSEMVDQSPRPLILPRASEDKPKSTVMRHVFEYTWDVADGDMELEDVLRDCLIYGMGFAQEFYWKDRRIVKQLESMQRVNKNKTKYSYTEKEVFEYDDCYMESVSPYELYFDETARTINRGPRKARDAIRRYIMKLDDVKRFFNGDVWNPFDNVKHVKAGGDTNYYSYYKPPEDIAHKDEVEVLWYWSRAPEDSLIIVANDVLLVNGPNPYKHKQLPFAVATDIKRPHKFYHKGEPKMLQSIQKELNTIRRMITDRNHLDIDKMWLVSRFESYDEDDTIARPHGMIRVDDPSNYKPIEYGDIPNSVKLSLDEINKDAIRVTGVEERFQSVKTPGTATEAAIMKESVLRRIRMKLRRLEKEFLVDIGRQRISNIIQFYSQPKLERIVGEVGTKEYRDKITDLRRKGALMSIEGVPFEKKFKEIRLKDRSLDFDEIGGVMEKPIQGYSFFELKPKFFMPVARGGFDIRFEAGATMPVSKSLLAKQTQDMAAMLMPLASAGIGYDPVKIGDDVIKSLDKDPEDFKIEAQEQDVGMAREEMSINLASQENEQVASGQPIPPMGTPYASSSHTQIHIAYLKSPVAKQMPEENYKLLVKHIMGEIAAQEMRGEVTGLTESSPRGSAPQAGSSPPYNQEMKAVMPELVQGGEENPDTQKGSVMNKVFKFLGRSR